MTFNINVDAVRRVYALLERRAAALHPTVRDVLIVFQTTERIHKKKKLLKTTQKVVVDVAPATV